MKKTTLGKFAELSGKKPAAASSAPVESAPPAKTPASAGGLGRRRGAGDTVSLSLRLNRAEWLRLRDVAGHEGLSMHGVMLAGLNLFFAERGLPALREEGIWFPPKE